MLPSVCFIGCGGDETDNEVEVESLYKELIGTYELVKLELTGDGIHSVVESPSVTATMTISSDQEIAIKMQLFEDSTFTRGTFEILLDEGVMSIDDETLNSKATAAYTWDGEILTMSFDFEDYVGTQFWRKVNNEVIDLEPFEPDPTPLPVEPPPSAALVRIAPPIGSRIPANATITLIFNGIPVNLEVSTGVLEGSGTTWRVVGPFVPGNLELEVKWDGGYDVIIYTVVAADEEPPVVTDSSVKDGEKDVIPELLFDGIEITFNENITGNIAITEAGEDVGWIDEYKGNKAMLLPIAGRELANETTYIIKGKVWDAAGNETEVNITFTTLGFE